jgi:hypothetical protein
MKTGKKLFYTRWKNILINRSKEPECPGMAIESVGECRIYARVCGRVYKRLYKRFFDDFVLLSD